MECVKNTEIKNIIEDIIKKEKNETIEKTKEEEIKFKKNGRRRK